jgi:hypothetical protein
MNVFEMTAPALSFLLTFRQTSHACLLLFIFRRKYRQLHIFAVRAKI